LYNKGIILELTLKISAVTCQISREGNTVAVRAMLSVRDTAIAAQKFSPEFEECSCSVPMLLLNNVFFVYDQLANIRSRQTNVVVTTMTGIPPGNANSYTRKHFAPVVRFLV